MLVEEVAKRLAGFPLFSQHHTDNPTLGVRLINVFGSGVIYLAEYDPVRKLVYGYLVGFGPACWGYASIEELAAVRQDGKPAVELDREFTPKPFKELIIQ